MQDYLEFVQKMVLTIVPYEQPCKEDQFQRGQRSKPYFFSQ